jgi:hypothetical protein
MLDLCFSAGATTELYFGSASRYVEGLLQEAFTAAAPLKPKEYYWTLKLGPLE